jgi:NAD(P)-dependent dehydrogenase (short-subunit alcohol dehydrogenase family)
MSPLFKFHVHGFVDRQLIVFFGSSFEEFAFHLHTNTIGPIICAQKLLQTNIPIGTIVFMSSDSGSAINFREMEDGFAAYAASKAALNMALRVSLVP